MCHPTRTVQFPSVGELRKTQGAESLAITSLEIIPFCMPLGAIGVSPRIRSRIYASIVRFGEWMTLPSSFRRLSPTHQRMIPSNRTTGAARSSPKDCKATLHFRYPTLCRATYAIGSRVAQTSHSINVLSAECGDEVAPNGAEIFTSVCPDNSRDSARDIAAFAKG